VESRGNERQLGAARGGEIRLLDGPPARKFLILPAQLIGQRAQAELRVDASA